MAYDSTHVRELARRGLADPRRTRMPSGWDKLAAYDGRVHPSFQDGMIKEELPWASIGRGLKSAFRGVRSVGGVRRAARAEARAGVNSTALVPMATVRDLGWNTGRGATQATRRAADRAYSIRRLREESRAAVEAKNATKAPTAARGAARTPARSAAEVGAEASAATAKYTQANIGEARNFAQGIQGRWGKEAKQALKGSDDEVIAWSNKMDNELTQAKRLAKDTPGAVGREGKAVLTDGTDTDLLEWARKTTRAREAGLEVPSIANKWGKRFAVGAGITGVGLGGMAYVNKPRWDRSDLSRPIIYDPRTGMYYDKRTGETLTTREAHLRGYYASR